jgi:hypothetical protein
VQLNWSTIQTEAYAIFVCCTQLAYLIRDRPFSIHTDHKNLTFMTKNSSLMVTRWYVALQEFDYTLHFVKGSQNTIADALSRLCPNLTELALPLPVPTVPEDGMSLAALRAAPSPSDDQLEALQMCHNAIIGHGGVDRTITKLFSLAHNWPYMRQHVRTFIRQCPCCQKRAHTYTCSPLRHLVLHALRGPQYRLRRSLPG